MDFLDEPDLSTRRTRNDGVYTSYYVDQNKRVKLLLLDIHYARDGEDDLGDEQLAWLEGEVMGEVSSHIFVLVFGSPLIANNRIAGDSVGKLTRKHIFELINRKKKFFLIISGELHFAEFTQLNFKTRPNDPTDLHEVTSSGLSHHVSIIDSVNSFITDDFNVSPAYCERPMHRFLNRNFGMLRIDLKREWLHVDIFDKEGTVVLSRVFDAAVITR